jgi:Tfp pilus assembly PilM family ATPase
MGDDALRLVQLQRSAAGSNSVVAAVALPYLLPREEMLKDPAGLRALLKQGLKQGPFRGRLAVACLASSDVRIMSITYQARPGESDDAAIGKLMRERIGEELANCVIDYVPVRTESRDGDRLALVMLTERSTVMTFLECFRKAGLDLDALEVVPSAIRRLVTQLIAQGHAPENVFVLNVGQTHSAITVVSGRRLLFDQQIAFGEDMLISEVALALDIPNDLVRKLLQERGLAAAGPSNEALAELDETANFNSLRELMRPQLRKLAEQIQQASLFAASETRGGRIEQIFILGGITGWRGAAELLADLVELPVREMPALNAADDSAPLGAEFAVAAGLALRGFDDA